MQAHASCRLTFRDWAILRAMLDRRPAGDPLTPLLRRKLAACAVVAGEELSPEIVTLDSRIVFTVDDGPADTRILVRAETAGSVGLSIPVTTPRGLALLGLRKGETGLVEREDGSMEAVRVEDVLFQPDAARWSAQRKPATGRTAGRPTLTLVHNVERPPSGPLRFLRGGGNDDPGPSAA